MAFRLESNLEVTGSINSSINITAEGNITGSGINLSTLPSLTDELTVLVIDANGNVT